MNDLRVCLVCDNFLPNYDGVVNVVVNYHKFFLKHNDSLLIVPKIGKKPQSNLKNIHYVPSTKLIRGYVTPYPHSDYKLNKVLAKFKPNIIHIHSPFIIGKYLLRYARKNNIPCLMTFHTKYDIDFKTLLKSKLFSWIALKSIIKTVNKVPTLYTVSRKMVQIMYSYGVNRSYKINVLRNATEFGVLSIKHEDEINKKFKIKNDDFLVVYVGRVVKYKNLNLIIKSANKLSKMTQQFKFLICGDGKHLKWMQDEVKKANMEHLFIFTGKIADRLLIQKIYARADLNIMISLFDTASLSIVEAASQYTPSLCIKNSTVSSDIKHQVNGYLVNNSSLAIAKSINSMMLKKTLHKAISKKAHRDLYISWETSLQCVKNIYTNIVAKKTIS